MDANGQIISVETALVAAGLLIFGILFNWFVMQSQKWTERYTAELVVVGVLVTVIASGFVIGWDNAFAMIVLFAASGAPMLIGFWVRVAQDEANARRELQKMYQKGETRDAPK